MTVLSPAKVLLFLLALALPVGFAQQFYLGAALGKALTSTEDIRSLRGAELGAQFGIDFLPSVGVRAALEGNPSSGSFELASGDAILRFYLPLSANAVYVGAGADAYFSAQPDAISDFRDADLAAHALAGLEFRLGRFGLFAEALPSYTLGDDFRDSDSYYLRARSGVNFHF